MVVFIDESIMSAIGVYIPRRSDLTQIECIYRYCHAGRRAGAGQIA
ncbi:hypothetical protein XaFJ1_GM002091 [Xanthomonas albilineans]|nr:hypothetical protein XaFJ1_GM002091 [Xanthomonas albilineans]